MIHRILALQNQGKTMFMAYKLYLDYLKGNTIFSNIHLKFPHYYINKDFFISMATQNKQYEFKNISWGLDEFWIWFDGQTPSKVNRVASYVLLQSSKMNWNIYTTAQTDSQDIKRLRQNSHYYTECKRLYKNPTDNKFYVIDTEQRFLPDYINQALYIDCKTYKRLTFGEELTKDIKLKALKLFDLFNTSERIYFK